MDQSRRLMAAGLKTETADMEWVKPLGERFKYECQMLYSPFTNRIAGYDRIPAWSMSALWELCGKTCLMAHLYATDESPSDIIESLVNAIILNLEESRHLKFQ